MKDEERRALAKDYARILMEVKKILDDGDMTYLSYICHCVQKITKKSNHHLIEWVEGMLNDNHSVASWVCSSSGGVCYWPNPDECFQIRHRWLDEMIAYMDKESTR